MRGFKKVVGLGLLLASGLAMMPGSLFAQGQGAPAARPVISGAGADANTPSGAPAPGATAGTPGASARETPAPGSDRTAIGKAVLNAGPDPRVQLDGLSRDHAAIFGTEDEDERALMDQERALEAQREQLRVLERVLNARPAVADPHPPATIPLNAGAPMTMPRLAPTPSGSQLDRTSSDTRRSVDEMQRRVNGLRRDADTLRQSGK
ncbi:hypothetical protein D3C85_325330 [compost metagenome]|uniref:hypothetical protein n=1 Tax=Achromobacter sp. Root83 TaxID=1736602 RepID=UPI000A5E36E4|nr:hypothetical protein [Achromobacter sp. Root83]